MFARLSGLSFSFADSVSILADVTLSLAPGWTGVVGPNGAGKTTLLRLISTELEPVAGHVYLDPPSAPIRVCAQTVETMTAESACKSRIVDLRLRESSVFCASLCRDFFVAVARSCAITGSTPRQNDGWMPNNASVGYIPYSPSAPGVDARWLADALRCDVDLFDGREADGFIRGPVGRRRLRRSRPRDPDKLRGRQLRALEKRRQDDEPVLPFQLQRPAQ